MSILKLVETSILIFIIADIGNGEMSRLDQNQRVDMAGRRTQRRLPIRLLLASAALDQPYRPECTGDLASFKTSDDRACQSREPDSGTRITGLYLVAGNLQKAARAMLLPERYTLYLKERAVDSSRGAVQ